MRDLSQFAPIAVFYVLQYLEMHDFIACILCCRAWYFSLNKPSYFRILQRNVIQNAQTKRIKEKMNSDKKELVSSKTKLKRRKYRPKDKRKRMCYRHRVRMIYTRNACSN